LSGEPFDDVEHAWFWFMQARRARADGAILNAGAGTVPRLCEPIDIYRQLDNLYRARRLLRDHLLVLRHYGERNVPPDPELRKEARAAVLWDEAMHALDRALRHRGLLVDGRYAARVRPRRREQPATILRQRGRVRASATVTAPTSVPRERAP
jgi:hypothetical protein